MQNERPKTSCLRRLFLVLLITLIACVVLLVSAHYYAQAIWDRDDFCLRVYVMESLYTITRIACQDSEQDALEYLEQMMGATPPETEEGVAQAFVVSTLSGMKSLTRVKIEFGVAYYVIEFADGHTYPIRVRFEREGMFGLPHNCTILLDCLGK